MLPVLCIVNLILLYFIVSTVDRPVHILLINVSQKTYSQMLVLEFGCAYITNYPLCQNVLQHPKIISL